MCIETCNTKSKCIFKNSKLFVLGTGLMFTLLLPQGRQEEELIMANAKLAEIAKKLAAVNPDSIVLKNNEPRSVMKINVR